MATLTVPHFMTPDRLMEIPRYVLRPVRGLVALHNAQGKALALADVHRWIWTNGHIFNLYKVDVLCHEADPALLKNILDFSRQYEIRLSLRVTGKMPPPDLRPLLDAGLLDVMIAPPVAGARYLEAWLRACAEAKVAVRLQAQPAFLVGDAWGALPEDALKPIKVVTLLTDDPVSELAGAERGVLATSALPVMNARLASLAAAGVEVNIFGVPLCHLDAELRPNAGDASRYFSDVQQYDLEAFTFGLRLRRYPAIVIGKLLLLRRLRHTATDHRVDSWVVEWLLLRDKKWFYGLALFLRRLTSHWRPFSRVPHVAKVGWDREEAPRNAGIPAAPCKECALAALCPSSGGGVVEVDTLRAVRDVNVYNTQALLAKQPKALDEIDARRVVMTSGPGEEHARRAVLIMESRAPADVRTTDEYGAINARYYTMSDAIRWHAWSNAEKQSPNMIGHHIPCVMAFTLGGGVAEYAGFCVNDTFRIVCPMLDQGHEIALFIDEEGCYTMLRDRRPVTPVEFSRMLRLPLRLPVFVKAKLSIWNIQERILTQDVKIWDAGDEALVLPEITFSFVIFSTRFARRLAAVLQSIAHQEGYDLIHVEVVLGYVPGLDAADDVIDSLSLTHPELRIVRSPFPSDKINAKGYVINRSVEMARGEWVILLDSDIVLPPRFIKDLAMETEDALFIVPQGRYMLNRMGTARVLLNELQPWQDWEAIVAQASAFREGEAIGLPIGFCQVIKASCFDKVRYAEYDHFEGADGEFGIAMRETFGMEKRPEGLVVAHLDHGGSKWFGTQRHY